MGETTVRWNDVWRHDARKISFPLLYICVVCVGMMFCLSLISLCFHQSVYVCASMCACLFEQSKGFLALLLYAV